MRALILIAAIAMAAGGAWVMTLPAGAQTDCHSEYVTDKIPYRWRVVCKGRF